MYQLSDTAVTVSTFLPTSMPGDSTHYYGQLSSPSPQHGATATQQQRAQNKSTQLSATPRVVIGLRPETGKLQPPPRLALYNDHRDRQLQCPQSSKYDHRQTKCDHRQIQRPQRDKYNDHRQIQRPQTNTTTTDRQIYDDHRLTKLQRRQTDKSTTTTDRQIYNDHRQTN